MIDWQSEPLALLDTMLRIRLFQEAEEAAYWQVESISRLPIRGEIHLAVGQEAIAAGVVRALKPTDPIYATYRGDAFLTARGTPTESLWGELYGRVTGLNGGYGGHMHLCDRERKVGLSAIVGDSVPLAAGYALGIGLRKIEDTVAVAIFGDGATNQGMLLETWNLSTAWNLPLLMVCEENGIALSTNTRQMNRTSIAERARAFGITVREVDGDDVSAVLATTKELRDIAKAGTPSLLVAFTSRRSGHMLNDPDAYREVPTGLDPIERWANQLVAQGLLTTEEYVSHRKEIAARIEQARVAAMREKETTIA